MRMVQYLYRSRNLIFQKFRFSYKRSMSTKIEDLSLGSITVSTDNPFDLFNKWLTECSKLMVMPTNISFILSTYSPKNKVTGRVMKFVGHKDEKFTFVGNKKSEKLQDLKLNPDVSMVCYWHYYRDKYYVLRQVRIKGVTKELERGQAVQKFNKLPMPLKVEYIVSRQNQPIKDWKAQQAEFTKKIQELKDTDIKMPDYITAYNIWVEEIQFFHNIIKTEPFFMADRVLFKKDGEKWKYTRIGA